MRPLQRFQIIMAGIFVVAAALSLWRILACGGGDIWYVPVVLVCAAGTMMVLAARNRNNNTKKE